MLMLLSERLVDSMGGVNIFRFNSAYCIGPVVRVFNISALVDLKFHWYDCCVFSPYLS
jgi:hypothetical protein